MGKTKYSLEDALGYAQAAFMHYGENSKEFQGWMNYYNSLKYGTPNVLPEVTVTAKRKPKVDRESYLTKGARAAVNYIKEDPIQTGLDVTGFIPGIDTFSDIAQVGYDLSKGDYLGAGLSAVGAVIPFVPASVTKRISGPIKKGFNSLKESYYDYLFKRYKGNQLKLRDSFSDNYVTFTPKEYIDILRNSKRYPANRELAKVYEKKYIEPHKEKLNQLNEEIHHYTRKFYDEDFLYKSYNPYPLSKEPYITDSESMTRTNDFVVEIPQKDGSIKVVKDKDNEITDSFTDEITSPMLGVYGQELDFSAIKKSTRKSIKKVSNSAPNIRKGLKEYTDWLTEHIGEDGLITGSTLQYANGFGIGVPGDVELYTTAARRKSLEDKIGFQHHSDGVTARKGYSDISYPKDESLDNIDIDIIEEKNGHATGLIAQQMYRTLHPKEWSEMIRTFKGNNFEDMELPISAEELYQEMRKNGNLLKNNMRDQLGSVNPKHQRRSIRGIIMADSERAQQLLEIQRELGKSYLGDGYKTVRELGFNIDFSDVEGNRKFLKRYNLENLGIEHDPVKMELLVEKLNFESLGQRSFTIPDEKLVSDKAEKIIEANSTTTANYNGGHAAGPGGNFLTNGDNSAMGYGDYRSIMQRNFDNIDKTDIKTADDFYEKVIHGFDTDDTLVTKEQIDAVNKFAESRGYKTRIPDNATKKDLINGVNKLYEDIDFEIPFENVDDRYSRKSELSKILKDNGVPSFTPESSLFGSSYLGNFSSDISWNAVRKHNRNPFEQSGALEHQRLTKESFDIDESVHSDTDIARKTAKLKDVKSSRDLIKEALGMSEEETDKYLAHIGFTPEMQKEVEELISKKLASISNIKDLEEELRKLKLEKSNLETKLRHNDEVLELLYDDTSSISPRRMVNTQSDRYNKDVQRLDLTIKTLSWLSAGYAGSKIGNDFIKTMKENKKMREEGREERKRKSLETAK